MVFDKAKWERVIRNPDWYLELLPECKRILTFAENSGIKTRNVIKEEIYGFFEKHLTNNTISLGQTGMDWDAERKPIDKAVIHHTRNAPGISWQRLNAIQLLRIYAVYYATPSKTEKYIKGQPIYSNHFRNDKQVFYTYHWLVRMDGTVERLLNDNEIGWHAGNWKINRSSVAIFLDNDFENAAPTDTVISSVVTIIEKYYPQIEIQDILGHREINKNTSCPGDHYLNGWQLTMFKQLDQKYGSS